MFTRLLRGFVGSPLPPTLYALYNGSADGTTYAIGAASKVGAGLWTPYGSNPVLQVGAGAAWDNTTVKDPWLLWDGSQYVCYYAGLKVSFQIGRATAPAHTGPWTKDAGNPVIALGAGGSFDASGCNFPVVLHEPADTGKEWKMWYGANDGVTGQRIGYAHSSDGVSWTKVGQVLDHSGGGTWEDQAILPMAIWKDGSTYSLFYGGHHGTTNPQWQGGVATFTNPEGTYTRFAGNPTLLARFNDAGVSLVLTSDTLTGSAVVHVTDTSAWHTNEAMVIADNNSVTENHAIASIDSGTQVTLDLAVTDNFRVANGATIRPQAYNSVTPRTILTIPTGYEMFGAAFQPVEDLTVGGSKLRESALRWTSAGLTGTWSYDYATGLMFPLFPANTGWSKLSAENPSVIVAP